MRVRKTQDVRDQDQYFRIDHLDKDLGSRTVRGGAVTVPAQICKFLISTAATIVLARLLTPEDYGLIGMVGIVVNFASMFQYMGLSTVTVKWQQLSHKQVSNLFWLNVALGAGTACLVALGSLPIATLFHEARLTGITIGFAFSIFLSGLAIQHEAILGRQMRFLQLAIIDVSSLGGGLVAALIAAWYGAGYWALVLNQLVVALLRIVGTWTACRWRPTLPMRDSGVRSMLSYGRNLTGFSLINFLARNLDNMLIGKYWGSYQLGLYAKAYQMLLLPMEQVNAPIAAVAVPALSRLAESPERYRMAYLKILEKIAMITMPGIAFMAATSDWLVLFLLGSQWRETGRIFMLLSLTAVIQPITRTVLWLFTTQNRTSELLRWGVTGTSIAVVAIIVGLPWGAVGVAASYASADLLLSTPLLLWYVGRKGPVRTKDFYKTIAPSVCAAISTIGILIILRPLFVPFPLFVRLALAGVVATVISLVVFLLLPTGRLAIQGFKESLLLLKNKNSESSV